MQPTPMKINLAGGPQEQLVPFYSQGPSAYQQEYVPNYQLQNGVNVQYPNHQQIVPYHYA